jgi:cell fate regulator YaaT (PSP1 superfamily)
MATTATVDKTSPFVGIRFQKLGKLYHFKLNPGDEVVPGDHVVVETRRGRHLGQVIAFVDPADVHNEKRLRTVERKANPRDLVMKQVWETKELDALITCREKAASLGIKNAKFVKTEYSFDGAWLTVYYTTENRKIQTKSLQ